VSHNTVPLSTQRPACCPRPRVPPVATRPASAPCAEPAAKPRGVGRMACWPRCVRRTPLASARARLGSEGCSGPRPRRGLGRPAQPRWRESDLQRPARGATVTVGCQRDGTVGFKLPVPGADSEWALALRVGWHRHAASRALALQVAGIRVAGPLTPPKRHVGG
jgi:hypothetical protein